MKESRKRAIEEAVKLVLDWDTSADPLLMNEMEDPPHILVAREFLRISTVPKVLIEVSGGCADYTTDQEDDVDILLVDYDNIESESEDPEWEEQQLAFSDGEKATEFDERVTALNDSQQ